MNGTAEAVAQATRPRAEVSEAEPLQLVRIS